MFYSNKSSILVSGEGNSSRSKMTSFMRILNLQRIVFLMCIVSSGEITWGMKDNKTTWKEKIKVEKLGSGSEEEINLEYNVIFLGNTQVGKTQIINKHVNRPFKEEHKPTIGVELATQKYKSTINAGNKIIHLKIWDTPGQEKFRTLLPNYANFADAIVLVYDVTNAESFNEIKKNWLDPAKSYNSDAVYFLVGNKTDLGEGAVTKEEAQKFADDNPMQFFEVSAMKGDNVDKLFEDIVKGCLEKWGVILNDIQDDKLENSKNNDSASNMNEKETNHYIQSTTHTKNKRCSCCPCNK